MTPTRVLRWRSIFLLNVQNDADLFIETNQLADFVSKPVSMVGFDLNLRRATR